MRGFGTLASAQDLLQKVRHDYAVMQADSGSSYAAYNFFVTAEHILDWLYPGDRGSEGAKRRGSERAGELLLQIVSNIANGAKHFQLNPERHDSVSHVDHSDSPYGVGVYGVGPYGSGDLTVTLEGEAAAKYGSEISALSLAGYVVRYWESHPGFAAAAV